MAHKTSNKEILGLTRITKKHIKELCKKDNLYQTPELNHVLYLHYQGFDCIESLDDYTELKCLWLECNAISEIQGLNKQTKLKCLFLQSNLIRKIENLGYCKDLDTLNLSQNHIRKIENCGFEVLPMLNTLNLASNYLKDYESLRALVDCKNLSVLDLSNNRIDDILVVKIFSQMPELKVLVFQGNPVVSKIPQYRKTLILECEKLTYLDSRPVFPKDRSCAEAWKRGGYAEERKENERWNRKERKKMRDGVNATISLRNKNRKPEDQISLLPSSDSEDEIKPQKKSIKIHLHSEDSSVESIWDEVTADKNSNQYAISNNGNADQNCGGSKEEATTNNTGDNIGIEKHHQIEEQDRVLGIKQSNLRAEKELTEQKEHCSQANFAEQEKADEINKFVTLADFNGKPFNELQGILSQNNLVTKHPDSDQDAHENYANTAEAIKGISLSLDSMETSPKLPVQEYGSKDENLHDNYDLYEELEETMNVFSQKLKPDQRPCKYEKKEDASQQEFENAKERLKVNNQLETDFEELYANMSNFLNELETEHAERQDLKNDLYCEDETVKDCSFQTTANETNSQVNQEEIDLPDGIMSKGISGSLPNYPEEVNDLSKVDNCTEHKMDLESDEKENVVHGKSISDLHYVPLNISSLTRKSNEALISLEKESKILKNLLQKLENKNEDLFKGTDSEGENEEKDESRKNFEADLRTNLVDKEHQEKDILKDNSDFYCLHNKQAIEEVQEVVEGILEEVLESSISKPLQRNSYLLPLDLIENEEDLHVTKNLTLPEKDPKTIPQVIKSFNQLLNEMKANRESSTKQMPLSLKELSQKPYLKQFNKDTLQSLNAQLEEIRQNQHKKVRRMVDRVCAQKDRYNDTIDLVDGKLMVRNHLTQELQTMSTGLYSQISDSEDGYDTAQSETHEIIEEENFKSFKPKPRKSSEDLVLKALKSNERLFSNDESDESTDEFYSLDGQDKPSLYKIDEELFKNLTFDLSNLTQQDENHIMQCAKSYEGLKHCLILKEKDKCLTEMEKKLLENMSKGKYQAATLQSDEEEQFSFHNNSSDDDQQQATSQLEKSCENTITKSYSRESLLKNQEPNNDFIYEKTNEETLLNEFQQSEEEKNEVENNEDIVNEGDCKKIFKFEANCE